MDMDESEDVDVAALERQQYSVYASKHAPTNYVPSQPSKKTPTRYYNKSLYNAVYSNKDGNHDIRRSGPTKSCAFAKADEKPVRDRNGEVLVPPSSSAGRLEEMRKKKHSQSAYNAALQRF